MKRVRRFDRASTDLFALSVCAGLALVLASAGAQAQVIDFETTPAGLTPVDDAPLASSAAFSAGGVQVNMGFDTDGNGSLETNALFELAGTFQGEGANIGFSGSEGFDTADPGFESQLDQWFLRSPLFGGNFGKFVIQYTSAGPVTAASGEIWDIDGNELAVPPVTEQYRVQAFDSGGALLATVDSPVGSLSSIAGAPLDGQPWAFAFSGLSTGIDHIEITFTGSKTDGIGLAFNNFYPTTVPEPAAITMLIVAGLSGMLRRVRNSSTTSARRSDHLLAGYRNPWRRS